MPTLVRRPAPAPDETIQPSHTLGVAFPLFLTVSGTVLLGCAALSFYFLMGWR